jgi:hypothetical protein
MSYGNTFVCDGLLLINKIPSDGITTHELTSLGRTSHGITSYKIIFYRSISWRGTSCRTTLYGIASFDII